jgi:uncharacterized Zn finger protein
MAEIVLFAKASSRDKPYIVTFTFNNSTLSIWCDCPAGEWGKLCKHKLSLATNNETMLYEENQVELLQKAYEWVKNSELPEAIEEIKLLENELENVKKKLKKAKTKLAGFMKDGV